MKIKNKFMYSKELKEVTNVVVIEPRKVNKDTIVVVYLHGLGGNSSNIIDKTNILSLIERLNIIIIAPEGKRSWYVSATYNYLSRELFTNLREYSNLNKIITGFSMGGYGAILLGETTNTYQAIGSISGSIDIVKRDLIKRNDIEVKEEWISIFGAKIEDKYNLFNYQSEKYKYITVGLNDHLLEYNRNYINNLTTKNYKYKESEGAHNYAYVNKELEPMLSELTKYVRRNKKIIR